MIITKSKNERLQAMAKEQGWVFLDDYPKGASPLKTCAAIICDDANDCIDLAMEMGIEGAQVDRAEKDMIVYWPAPQAETPEENP